MKVIASTEVWARSTGKVAKAVFRNTNGTFVGATNQTKEIPIGKVVRPRVTLVGR